MAVSRKQDTLVNSSSYTAELGKMLKFAKLLSFRVVVFFCQKERGDVIRLATLEVLSFNARKVALTFSKLLNSQMIDNFRQVDFAAFSTEKMHLTDNQLFSF